MEEKQIDAFCYISVEDRIPTRHPIRSFKVMVNEILRDMDADLESICAASGRPSLALEYLLRASIRQILYSIQKRRKRVEEIFGWAKKVGLIRKAKMRGRAKLDWLFTMSIAVFNFVRMRNMEEVA